VDISSLYLLFKDKEVDGQKSLGNPDVEEGSAMFGRTAWRGKWRIFQE